jgi:hypothetical protein
MRLAKPHSLSNQTKQVDQVGAAVRVWLPSTMAECGSWLKSIEAWASSE